MMTVRWRTVTRNDSGLLWSWAFPQCSQRPKHEGGGHTSPVIAVLLALAMIILAAKIGGDIMVRLRQPEVLGELIVGIILGNLVAAGNPYVSLSPPRPRVGDAQ